MSLNGATANFLITVMGVLIKNLITEQIKYRLLLDKGIMRNII